MIYIINDYIDYINYSMEKECPGCESGVDFDGAHRNEDDELYENCCQNVNNEITYYKNEPDIQTIQKIVEGYFTIIPLENNRLLYICEDGELRKLQINKKATELVGYEIYGNSLIVG